MCGSTNTFPLTVVVLLKYVLINSCPLKAQIQHEVIAGKKNIFPYSQYKGSDSGENFSLTHSCYASTGLGVNAPSHALPHWRYSFQFPTVYF